MLEGQHFQANSLVSTFNIHTNIILYLTKLFLIVFYLSKKGLEDSNHLKKLYSNVLRNEEKMPKHNAFSSSDSCVQNILQKFASVLLPNVLKTAFLLGHIFYKVGFF